MSSEVELTLPCPSCGGSGSMEEPNPFFEADDDESAEDEFHQVACRDCHGEASLTVQPCPHCGGTSLFVERDDLSSAYVFCNDCGAKGPSSTQEGDDEETPGGFAAIKAWNRRSASPSIGRVGVKWLVWKESGLGFHNAETPFGTYSVIPPLNAWKPVKWCMRGENFDREAETVVGAKAAAQADYEARIRSTLVYHEEPAGDTQGALPVGYVKETAETEHVERDVLSGETTHAVGEVDFDALPLLVRIQSVLGDPVVDIEHHLHDVEGLLNEARDALAALVSPPDNGEPGNG